MRYNYSNITDGNTDGYMGLFHELNHISGQLLAWVLLVLIFAIVITIVTRHRNFQVGLLSSSFITSLTALIFRLIQVGGVGMVSTKIVVILWLCTAIFAAIMVGFNKQ